MTDRKMVAVTEADGKLVWEVPFAAMGMGATTPRPPSSTAKR